MAKRGVFWLIEEELLVVKYEETAAIGVSKNGTKH